MATRRRRGGYRADPVTALTLGVPPNRHAKLALVGHICVDMRVRPSGVFPKPGQLVDTDTIDMACAGMIGNAGRVLGRFSEPVMVVCRVGDDALGHMAVAELSQWADTAYVTTSSTAPTSATIVFVLPDGERSFIHAKGANAEFAGHHVPLHAMVTAGIKYLHIGYALLLPGLDGEPMSALLQQARSLGLVTSLDMTWDATGAWMSGVGTLLPHVDIFCPNDTEAESLTGEREPLAAARALIKAGVSQLAVVTCGANGIVAAWPDGRSLTLPAPPTKVVDSTGAGDCFSAALLTALARGLPDEDALRAAVDAAALALQAP